MLIRALNSAPEIERLVELQKLVWRFADLDVVPVTEILAAAHNDGIVLGAFDDADRLLGFTFSFVGRRNGRFFQYSRMLAVHPDHRGGGLGAALKLEQKRIALEKGYPWMEWTFDPLEARNAQLNLRRLGARVRTYRENYYGNRTSQFDLGVPTDRCLAEWDLTEDLAVTGPARSAAHVNAPRAFAVDTSSDLPRPGRVSVDLNEPVLIVPVPSRFQSIRETSTEIALEWRFSVREAASLALANGYAIVDFLPELPDVPGLGAHVLAREGTV